MSTLLLGAKPLTPADIKNVAIHQQKVSLAPSAVQKIKKSYRFLMSEVASGKTHYGVNTGFGLMSSVRINEANIESLQYNLLRSHAVGTGAALPDSVVRAMLLLRAANLAHGYSGVRLELVEQILLLLNRGVYPVVPEQGSVGASGDLAPLSHLALGLIGEGRSRYQGREMSGKAALKAAKIKPIRLGPKEGLALINGTQFMTAIGALTLCEAEHLLDVADFAAAQTLEALRGTSAAFDPLIQSVRPHPGQIHSAHRVVEILKSGTGRAGASEIARSHEDCGKVQDPYSLRCVPQVHGASRDALSFVRSVIEREINSVTDNPLVFPPEGGKPGKILSGGNFHGQIVAIALDTLAIAIAEIASISEERIAKLVNPALSDLPAFLVKEGGLNSGFMIVQVAAAAIVSESKTLCHPASVDSIPTSADKEDHVSMGAWAARKAALVTRNTRRVLSMELLSGAQGIDLLRPLRSSKLIERLHGEVRKRAAKLKADRTMYEDIQNVEKMIEHYEIESLVRLR